MIKILAKKTYLAALENSEGIEAYKNVFAEVDGAQKDIAEDGNLSCSLFVSATLLRFKLISEMHITVPGLIADLKRHGWYETPALNPGAVLVWEEKNESGLAQACHRHAGFYLGDGIAISNNSGMKKTHRHPVEKDNRKVEMILWHDFLNE